MGNFFNNGPKILKLIVRFRIYISYFNKHLEKNCWFENWIFKNFFLKIYRSQTDYTKMEYFNSSHFKQICENFKPFIQKTIIARYNRDWNNRATHTRLGRYIYIYLKFFIQLWKKVLPIQKNSHHRHSTVSRHQVSYSY